MLKLFCVIEKIGFEDVGKTNYDLSIVSNASSSCSKIICCCFFNKMGKPKIIEMSLKIKMTFNNFQ